MNIRARSVRLAKCLRHEGMIQTSWTVLAWIEGRFYFTDSFANEVKRLNWKQMKNRIKNYHQAR